MIRGVTHYPSPVHISCMVGTVEPAEHIRPCRQAKNDAAVAITAFIPGPVCEETSKCRYENVIIEQKQPVEMPRVTFARRFPLFALTSRRDPDQAVGGGGDHHKMLSIPGDLVCVAEPIETVIVLKSARVIHEQARIVSGMRPAQPHKVVASQRHAG